MNLDQSFKAEKRLLKSDFKKLTTSPFFKFPQQGKKLLVPKKQGVYIIYNQNKIAVHVGRTLRGKEGLQQRLLNHLRGQSYFTRNYLKGDGSKLRGRYYYRYLIIRDARRRALLEALAIGMLCPKYIGLGK
jgi:hypothetical protein